MQIIAKLKQNLGMSISIILHVSLFILLLVSFPQCQHKKPQEIIISLDLLPISKNTNVENKQIATPKTKEEKPIEKPKPIEEIKPEEPKPETKPEEPKPETKPEEPKPEIKPEEPKPEAKPEPKQEIKPVIKEEKVIEKKKPEAKKIEKKKKPAKPKVNEYDSLLKSLEKTTKINDALEPDVDKPSKGPHDSNMPLSLSVKDAIKKQIEQCWNPPAGNMDAGKLAVVLNITFQQDGEVISVKIEDNFRYNTDELYRVAADAAIRAVHKASPLQGLPVEQFSSWQYLEFHFDPSGLIY